MWTTPRTREKRRGKVQRVPQQRRPKKKRRAASLYHLKVVQDGHDVLRHEDVSRVDGHAQHGDQQGIWGRASRRNAGKWGGSLETEEGSGHQGEGNPHGLTDAGTTTQTNQMSLMFLQSCSIFQEITFWREIRHFRLNQQLKSSERTSAEHLLGHVWIPSLLLTPKRWFRAGLSWIWMQFRHNAEFC